MCLSYQINKKVGIIAGQLLSLVCNAFPVEKLKIYKLYFQN